MALRTLEPDLSGLDQLLSAFVGMIVQQIELAASMVGRTRNAYGQGRRAFEPRVMPANR